MSVRGIDLSNYAGALGSVTAACLRQQGVGHVVVRCSLESDDKATLTGQQLAACQAAGLGVSAYCWAYFGVDDPAAMAAASIRLAGAYTDLYWIDCEETDARWRGTDAAQRSAWLAAAVAAFQAAGQRVGIYTGRWWWQPYMGDTAAFAALPLWTAEYDGVPDLGVWTPYGGWTTLAGKQYEGSGTGRCCGLAVDLNVFDAAVLAGNGGDDLSAEERAELEQYRADQPYYDTLLGSKDQPGGLIGSALDTMVEAAGTSKTTLARVVREQCASVRKAAGL